MVRDIEANDGTEVKTTKGRRQAGGNLPGDIWKERCIQRREKYMGVMRFTSETKIIY